MTMKDENQNVILKSNVNNSITYTGRRYDSESELYYYRNRMYSAQLGRFIQQDPKGYVDGMNLYAYVKNNPLKYLDAMGTTAYINNTKSDGIIGTIAGWYSNVAQNFSNNGTQTHQNRLSTKFIGIGGTVVGRLKLGYDLITSTSIRDVARVVVVTTAGGVAGVAAGTATATVSIALGVSAPLAPYAGIAAGLWAGGKASDYAGKIFDKYF